MSKTYGYARTSSKDQREDRQILALNRFGVEQIFVDQQSGKNFDRPQYKKLRKLKKYNTDCVIISLTKKFSVGEL